LRKECIAQAISIHSFHGGTGKSKPSANLAVVLDSEDKRVGVIDTDIQSPGIHVIFGLDGEHITSSLNDFLWSGHARLSGTGQSSDGRRRCC